MRSHSKLIPRRNTPNLPPAMLDKETRREQVQDIRNYHRLYGLTGEEIAIVE